MKSTLSIIVFLAVAIGGMYLGYQYGRSTTPDEMTQETDSSETVDVAYVHGQGKLQPAEGTISIVAPPGERIDQVLVTVGQQVEKDAPLVLLASQQIRELELALAKTRKTEAQTQAEIKRSANEFQLDAAAIASSEAESTKEKVRSKSRILKPMRTQMENAKRVLEKLQSMREKEETRDLVGQSEIDKQQSLVDSLKVQIQQAEDEVAMGGGAAERAIRLAENQKELAAFNLQSTNRLVPTESLDLAIELAQLALDSTSIKSPVAGTVMDIAIHQGETVTNRPLMIIGNTKSMVCLAEITDSQLRRVSVGAEVELSSAALDRVLKGKVVEVGTMIGPPSMVDPNPYAVVDRKTGKVKIELIAEDVELAAKFVNLQVDVKVATDASVVSDESE